MIVCVLRRGKYLTLFKNFLPRDWLSGPVHPHLDPFIKYLPDDTNRGDTIGLSYLDSHVHVLQSCHSATLHDMTAVLPLTWQTFRLGLQSCQSHRAALSALRTTFRLPQLSKPPVQQLFSLCPLPRCGRPFSVSDCQPRQIRSVCTTSAVFNKPLASLQTPRIRPSRPPAPRTRKAPTALNQAQITALFGKPIAQERGNAILVKLQRHRREGTLDYKLEYPEQLVARALRYLRAKYPIDENAAIIARVDRELDSEFRLPQQQPELSPYAHSGLEEIQKENKERYAKEKAEREAKEKEAEQQAERDGTPKGVAKPRTLKNLVQRSEKPPPEWVQQHRNQATVTEIPAMSIWARLVPSGLFTAAVVALSVVFAMTYTPPSRDGRLFPDTPPAVAVMWTVLVANFGVYVAWKVPSMWRSLNRYFLVVPMYPYAPSMLFAEFSHQLFLHMGTNMLAIWLVGTRCTSPVFLLDYWRYLLTRHQCTTTWVVASFLLSFAQALSSLPMFHSQPTFSTVSCTLPTAELVV